MKKFGKKKARPERTVKTPVVSDPDQSFYGKSAGEAPLTNPSAGYGQRGRRMGGSSPAKRRENNTRTSDWKLLLLLVKAGLIVAVIFFGYLALRFFVGLRVGPSEKDLARWEHNETLREKGAGGVVSLATIMEGESAPALIEPELIEERLTLWEQAGRHMRAAEALARRGIDRDAIRRLTQALRLVPEHAAAQKLLLEMYMRSELYAEAVPLCIRLLDQDSQQWDVRLDLLTALQETGAVMTSLVLADHMLQIQPNHLEVLERAAYAQAAQGNAAKALALYEKILLNDSTHFVALLGAGFIYQQTGAWEKAIPYYMELVREDPKSEHYHSLAHCYAQQNEGGKTVIFLGQAASLYGESDVSDWLSEAEFDPVRETVEFRSFVDRVVGIETRKAIEEIRLREKEKENEGLPSGVDLPAQPELQLLTPGR